jgi:hypothetical protein
MNIYTVLIGATLLSVALHFIGVYANAKKTVWLTIVLLWAGSISIAMSEVKPSAYDKIDKIKGKYESVDAEIQEALPKISVYEMIGIMKKYKQAKKASSEH